ncbi:hypothetical protein GGR53DRAFT_374745 [Hypoxylon sp. FL1150]|nr:hypothetical protein GGR53DRAFT_374745 [Hypoxylon sp. FL1150]
MINVINRSVDEEKYVCEVQRLPMDEWLKKGWDDKTQPLHVMKVYYRSVPAPNQVEAEKVTQAQIQGPRSEKPLRVVINSKPLIQNLEEITGTGLDYQSLVINSPYKLFAHAWPQMKPYLAQLKVQQPEVVNDNKSDETSRPIETTVEKSPSEDPLDNETKQNDSGSAIVRSTKKLDAKVLAKRIEHLELLVGFIETDLAHMLKLQKQIKELTLESIAFEDLWYLFNPGDTLYTKESGHPQLYTAYMVTGGKQRLRNPTRDELDEIRTAQRSERTESKWFRHYNGGSESSDDEDDRPRIQASDKGSWTTLIIDCYRMAYDGSYIGPIDSLKKIPYFVGKRRITDLSIFPLKFHHQSKEISQLLEQRGRRYIHCTGHRSYDGLVFDRRGRPTKEELQGDVYIDFEEYYRSQKKWNRPKLGKIRMSQPDGADVTELDPMSNHDRPKLIELMDFKVDELRTHTFLSEKTWERELFKPSEVLEIPDLLVLLPHWVVGFAFRNRTWAHLDLDGVTEIDKSDEARKTGFNELVIPPKYRKLLVSLVESHASGSQGKTHTIESDTTEEPIRQIDLVRGKGLGLIILLHGPPGSGKTSTAETVAAYTGRPLYIITCGDLGLESEKVEKTLALHTRRADKWGCVLLLDEADVFLVKRDWKDMNRNALVAVFLRQLEYYAGILFLTTNRVGVLDEAFKSRIHISLRYPKIEQRQTRKIWKNILDRLERDNKHREVRVDFDREELLEYAETQFERLRESETTWNGRQIRNAFQTAIALGEYERSIRLQERGLTSKEAIDTGKKKWRRLKLSTEYFDTIADTAQEFEDYLDSVFGQRAPDRALEEYLRNDNYDNRASLRNDRSNLSASYSRNPLSSGASQRLQSSIKPSNMDPGISRAQSFKTTALSTGQGSSDDSDVPVDGDGSNSTWYHKGKNNKGKEKERRKKASKSSDSESD